MDYPKNTTPKPTAIIPKTNNMAQYRKKPVVIEAVQWNAEAKNFDEVMNFMQDFHGNKFNYENAEELAYKSKELHIRTLEGVMTASNLDWIIKRCKW